jgi:polysaccharide pyruvyl transferase WcaK-like protein
VQIYVSGLGQSDNIGDTVLRRGFMNALRPSGSISVFVGNRGAGYERGLGLQEGDSVYRDAQLWRRKLFRSLLAGRSMYAFGTGEMQLDRRYAGYYIRLWPLLAVSRLRGGKLVHVGLGVRRKSVVWGAIIQAVLQLCHIVSWRDAWSRTIMNQGGVSPDWAFNEGPSIARLRSGSAAGRNLLAISLRHDRPYPSSSWVEEVKSFAESLGLEPLIVTQVRRDETHALRLAEELGGNSVVWSSADHREHEVVLRDVYSRSLLVLSERLHAAVIGLTEGALPLVLAAGDHDKATRTLDAVGISHVSVSRLLEIPGELTRVASHTLARRPEIIEKVVEARIRLDALSDELAGI